jgi:hypothetical protein
MGWVEGSMDPLEEHARNLREMNERQAREEANKLRYELDSHQRQLDELYGFMDWAMKMGFIELIDFMLANVVCQRESADMLLGYLVSTLPVRSKLPSRERFCQEAERVFRSRGIWEPGMLNGLR